MENDLFQSVVIRVIEELSTCKYFYREHVKGAIDYTLQKMGITEKLTEEQEEELMDTLILVFDV